MSAVLLVAWIAATIVTAFGLIAAGYNGDDGWSVVFLAALLALAVAGLKAGWIG
jgi:hypothetical protein